MSHVRNIIENGRKVRRGRVTEAKGRKGRGEPPILFVIPWVAGDSRRNLRIYGSAACGFSFSTERPVVGNSAPPYDDGDGDSINIYGDSSIPFCRRPLPSPLVTAMTTVNVGATFKRTAGLV